MERLIKKIDFETKQYYTQANLVYISTFFSLLIIIPIFIVIGNLLVIIVNFLTLFATIFALLLNRKRQYQMASLLFISAITIQNVIEIAVFGRGLGFAYYFFTIVALIVFTKWKNVFRLSGIIIVILLALGVFFYTEIYAPLVILSYGLTVFFNIINTLFNVAGVANSANFYLNIARKTQGELEKLAMQDFLTGLPNRAALDDYVNNFRRLNNKKPCAVGVLMLDIDHFKIVNDTYGHTMGDMVLKQTAIILLQHRGDSDFVGRYGGEEFIMIIQADTLQKTHQLAEHLRHHFEEFAFNYQNITLNATISIGAIHKMCDGMSSFKEAIEKADALLYQAKQEGRNKVVSRDISDY